MPRFHVVRSADVGASPQQVYETIADYGTWASWSPWLHGDPDARVTVSPNASSVGSVYAWKGEIVGEGEIEHRRLDPGRRIEDELRFMKPFPSRCPVVFEMEPTAEGTTLRWQMDGSLPWFMFWMRASMERYIGMDYERGLKMLKERVETGQVLSKTVVRGVESIGPLRVAGVRRKCEMRDVGASMSEAFDEAARELSQRGLPVDGEPVSVYHKMDMQARTFDYTGGFAIPAAAEASLSGLANWSIPATKALVLEHIGSYDNLGNAWSAAYQVVRYRKLRPSKSPPFEIYRNDPERTAAAELRTEIYVPLR